MTLHAKIVGLSDSRKNGAESARSSGVSLTVSAGFPSLIADVWRDRGFGDFWGYALVAEGAAEAMVEIGPKSWDLAAPLVIVEEAGGRLTDLQGRRTIHSGTVLASNGRVHDEILNRLRGG